MTGSINYKELIDVIPMSKENIERLQYLKEEASDISIAVFGKYNHGKSTLLNALIGHDEFKTADKRETIENKEFKKDGVIWIDTPGLDADIKGEDDAKAREGAFKIADFLFLIHNVKAGELDKYESELYQQLMRQDKNYSNKIFLILTQIDQLPKNELDRVKEKIYEQMPNLKIFPVSAIRHIRGKKENKEKFIELSGINELFILIGRLIHDVDDLRKNEVKRLKDKAKVELLDALKKKQKKLNTLEYNINIKSMDFIQDVDRYCMQVTAKKR